MEEIEAHRDLATAERGYLAPVFGTSSARAAAWTAD
jgi:hypothetical protein